MIVGSTCSDKSIITIFHFRDIAKVNVGGAFLYEGEEYLVTYVSKEHGWCHVDRPMDVKSKPRDQWHSVEYHPGDAIIEESIKKEETLVTFAEYEKLITDTARAYDESDVRAKDGSHIPTYSALGLAGEAGEVVEMVKKAMRTLEPMDKAKLCLELGDVLWYIGRMAGVLGFSIGDVAAINSLKLRRRQQYGKDASVEEEVARVYLGREKETP